MRSARGEFQTGRNLADADANDDGPAYDDGLHPIAVPGIVAGFGVVTERIDRFLPAPTLPSAASEALFLGAALALLVVVTAKTVRSRSTCTHGEPTAATRHSVGHPLGPDVAAGVRAHRSAETER